MSQAKQVHAPYHFVPLSKWVYMPDWAHQVSHDVPFKDGLSGVIEYALKNTSPLCVGGEQIEPDGTLANGKRNKPSMVTWARNPNNEPVIPGTSLKGVIRSALEVATFSKFGAIDENHFSFRDISGSDTKYAKELKDTKVQAYWLRYDAEIKAWTLRKAQHTVLFSTEFCEFSEVALINHAEQTVEKKYQLWPLTKPALNFDLGVRELEGTKGNDVPVERATNMGRGQLKGYPVFVGFRPGKKEYCGDRLNYNYLFYGEAEQVIKLPQLNSLANKLFANHDKNLVDELKRNPHPELGIPVFAREDKGKVVALGFAKMPRKLYDLSVHQVAHNTQKLMHSENIFDFSELLFGTLRDKGFSLKSRIAFSDASCITNKGLYTSAAAVLGQPKASYLPAYLEQHNAKGNQVYNELSQYQTTSELKGWKRYPARQSFQAHLPKDLAEKFAIQSQLELMDVGSHFSGKIMFHNLKPAELGALLWGLGLGEDEGKCHTLGHGKSLGAGSVKMEVTELKVKPNNEASTLSVSEYQSLFVESMEAAYPGESWLQSPQLQHILSFADAADNVDKELTYMPLQSEGRTRGEMSYVESTKGRDKSVLPDWQAGGEAVTRKEALTDYQLSTSYASGRLNGLFNIAKSEERLSQYEMSQFEMRQQLEQEVAKAAKLEQLSEEHKQFETLKEKLSSQEVKLSKDRRQAFNPDIEQMIDLCLSVAAGEAFAQELYDICHDVTFTAYLDIPKNNRKNKDKLKARQAKVQSLLEAYNLKAS